MEIRFFDIMFMFFLQIPVCWKSLRFFRRHKPEIGDIDDVFAILKNSYGIFLNIFLFPIFYLFILKNDGIMNLPNMLWKIGNHSLGYHLSGLWEAIKAGLIYDYFRCFAVSNFVFLITLTGVALLIEKIYPLEIHKEECADKVGNDEKAEVSSKIENDKKPEVGSKVVKKKRHKRKKRRKK